MRTNNIKDKSRAAFRVLGILSFAAVAAFGQQQVNLTAAVTTTTLPDGTTVPMWGYSCGAVVSGSGATCAALNPAAGATWSPVVITIPATAAGGLSIKLTNNLPGSVPTSMVIVGLLGGGLGTTATPAASPTHAPQPLTWPVAGAAGDPTNVPPTQLPRVQSFSTEVATHGVSTPLPAWTLRPGTYLIESGTHPSIQGPMGLYGMLVVTGAGNTDYGTGTTYAADVKLLLSEIDPVQNNAVSAAVNAAAFSETLAWSGQPGGCGNPSYVPSAATPACYPPAVNYSPLYYLFNGVAFSKTNAAASAFPTTALAGVTGNVQVRFVNAGLRMHIPVIVGAQTGTPAVPGFSLIAEDGNRLPGAFRVQSSVFLAAGKTYDVMINAPATSAPALAVFDRNLSLSTNNQRDGGMQAYININGTVPSLAAPGTVAANADVYGTCSPSGCIPLPGVIAAKDLVVSDPAKGLIANDVNVYGVKLAGLPTKGVLYDSTMTPNKINADGTFTYRPNAGWTSPDTFTYQANGTGPIGNVTLNGATLESGSGITLHNESYTSTLATSLSIKSPGILLNASDAGGYPLKVDKTTIAPAAGLTVSVDETGAFTARVSTPGTYTFDYKAKNSQNVQSASAATVTLVFPAPSNLQVTVVDGKTKAAIAQDYRWIIEEDRTFFPSTAANISGTSGTTVTSLGTNFHTSYMPVLAQGCTGTTSCESGQTFLDTDPASPTFGKHVGAACDVGNGVCRVADNKTPVTPDQAVLDINKRYYISVLPGDATGTDANDNPNGHAMGGHQIAYVNGAWQPVTVIVEQMPLPPGKVSVFVFEDDSPLNGEHDAGGGIDTLSPDEPGLGQFNITLFDDAGGTGDATGQMTYDMFNMPLSNSLAGTLDPTTHIDACPISQNPRTGFDGTTSDTGITGVIPVCPKYESDGKTLSPLAGQAVIANLPPGRYGVVATPGADRIARGEEWLQTNTLDGGKAHDSFIKVHEPSYFQEFGPAGYHVSIGFANPKIINDRLASLCPAPPGTTSYTCGNTVTGKVTLAHMSRTPDERLYSTGSRSAYGYTQCYASLGSPDSDDFAFAKCGDDGVFTFTNIPSGDWRVTIFDQWNDQVVDGISEPIRISSTALCAGPASTPTICDMGDVAAHQWKTDIYTRTFFDVSGDGVSQDNEPGLSLVATNIRFRDGSYSNFNSTDLNGFAGFNEVFPLFNWYLIETDSTRYKNTGIHVVYDAGGPVDPGPTGGSPECGKAGYPTCGSSAIGAELARTKEDIPVPVNLRVPGARYCAQADCLPGDPGFTPPATGSTGRVDPPMVHPYGASYGWQGFAGQSSFLEFGKKPYAPTENGGIRGHVVYASTRPFDDPALLLQLSWEPMVPHVRINLYQEGTAPDGSQSLKLVDHTETSSFDDWAQGFRSGDIPNMNCPGQGTATGTNADLFFFTLKDQPMHLTPGPVNSNAQYKCYDGQHNWNQLQPAPYDGMYVFPSVTSIDPATGKPAGTNCTACTTNPDTADAFRSGLPMLPAGKYVVEVIVPPGYELVKEEDKNILLGDAYLGPVTTQFAGLGNIFIMPDQASVAATYNPNNPQNPTTNLGAHPRHEGDTGSVETFWPCVGQTRVVPDFVSLFPGSGQVSPFAGASRPLCDRKEVILDDQMQVLAKFYVFTSTHVAAHFTGVITDDFRAEFDPFSPQFGEKFAPANLPVSIKDWAGNEVSRIHADQWGAYNGLNYSTWGVNPPAPTGYVPQMMVLCMNDSGNLDPLFQKGYSQFCYELPFMPGQTGYFDTPVVPTSAFSDGYNRAECDYPDGTPAIKQVDGDGIGPWVAGPTAPVALVTVNNGGTSYTTPPAVAFSGGGGTGAAATATLRVRSVTVATANRGSGYTTTPAVTIAPAPAGGTNATATAVLGTGANAGRVISITVNNPGNGYTTIPTVTIAAPTPPGAGKVTATATAVMAVSTVSVTNGGSGYTSAPSVSITGGDGSGALATAVLGPPNSTAHTLTITSLGPQQADNYGYSGPSATSAPFNAQTISRDYGFGPRPSTCPATGACPNVTIGDQPLTNVSWSTGTITGTVPTLTDAQSNCHLQQRGAPIMRCGELNITAANGKKSIDTVTVTIGGTPPTPLAAGQTIQQAIDAANPGDMIIVPPGTYTEMLLMWKPVRLQGVGAGSTILNANTQPASEKKLGAWRRQVTCLFGLALNGRPISGTNPYDPTAVADGGFTCDPTMQFKVDRLPLEATVGWDATLNGNLAEQLQEPTLMGAYEGAAITVLSKGVIFPNGGADAFAADTFPDGTTLLTDQNVGTANCTGDYASNFRCNPSRIDGLTLANSSQGGGGIFVHAWGHNVEISNNRIHSNQGTLSGGIMVGQGEHPTQYLGGDPTANAAPGSCATSNVTGLQLPYCFDQNVYIHNNAITQNSSEGDELFSATPAGAGGVTFCSGADSYKFNNNWLCGNLSSGDGGGLAQLGFAPGGVIANNAILFNQSTNPTVPTNGGGIVIMGAPDTDPTCPGKPDADCGIGHGLGDGTGNVTINANLIMGNAAESGSGGGIRLQGVNGTEIVAFPATSNNNTTNNQNFARWYKVDITNNIIANNVAGWDGAGVSLNDALVVNFVNNTVVANDSTASSGVLFGAFFASQASDPTKPPNTTTSLNDSAPQPAGLVATGHSLGMLDATGITNFHCPTDHPNCKGISDPILTNNVFWQNRAFHITVGPLGGGATTGTPPTTNQQHVVTLVPALNQSSTGACVSSTNYWDIGVRGDTAAGNHASGFTLAPKFSVLTNSSEVGLGSNDFTGTANNPNLMHQYCNGSRIPPEFGGTGYQVPAGTYEGNGAPLPLFNLTAGATVDEGNNWINISFGPLALSNPTDNTHTALGDFHLTSASVGPVNHGTTPSGVPNVGTDFFGTPRPQGSAYDIGAVEFTGTLAATLSASVTPNPLAFGNVAVSATSAALNLTVTNTGTAILNGFGLTGLAAPFARLTTGTFPAGAPNCGATLALGASCTIKVTFAPTSAISYSQNVTIAYTTATVTPTPVNLTGTGVAGVVSATLTPATWTLNQVRNCPGTTLSQILACTLDPLQTFTLTNTGNVTLTGITQAQLAGVNTADYTISRALSTCGPAGNGQVAANTTLAPGATCAVRVQFKPLTSEAAGLKSATVSVTDAAGTQTSTLAGTAQ
jgi:hypothetical protein